MHCLPSRGRAELNWALPRLCAMHLSRLSFLFFNTETAAYGGLMRTAQMQPHSKLRGRLTKKKKEFKEAENLLVIVSDPVFTCDSLLILKHLMLQTCVCIVLPVSV